MKLEIEKIIYPGRSLGRVNGKTVLSDEGLPGETADVSVIFEKKNYAKGKTIGIDKASPDRVSPRCAHYKACSPYQYIDYPAQIKTKEAQINEMFGDTLKNEGIAPLMRPARGIWGYRNKIDLKIIKDNGALKCAYSEPGANDKYIIVDECFLAGDKINKIASESLKIINEVRAASATGISVRGNNKNDQFLITLYGDGPKGLGALKAALSGLTESFQVKGALYVNTRNDKTYILFGDNFIESAAAGRKFFIGAGSFFQVNYEMLEVLINDMRAAFPERQLKTIADLYCGAGLFSVIFSGAADFITGIEENKESIYFLRKNIEANALKNITVIEAKCADTCGELLKKHIDLLILDPPRKGLEKALREAVLSDPPENIFYVSCDPPTLKRDLAELVKKYKPLKFYNYDFFPHTVHIESLAVLRKRY